MQKTAALSIMAMPEEPVLLVPEQVSSLNQKLADMRHNVNNSLSLVTAVVEIINRKPELAQKLLANLVEQPQKIIDEIRKFSNEFERVVGITRD